MPSPGRPRGLIRPPAIVHAHGRDDHDHHASDAPRAVRPARPHAVAPSPLVALAPGARHPDSAHVGAKAVSIAWLARQGVPVPAAVAVPVEIAADLAHDDPLATELVGSALRRWLDPDASYAIRSSVDGDHGALRAFAGQFPHLLDVPAHRVVAAVREVAAVDRDRLAAHARRTGDGIPERVAVVIQEMVPASGAGVVFSRNPVTGLDEVVVEAVQGPGATVVAGAASPDRWVRRWGAFTDAPDAPRVPAPLVESVAVTAARLAATGEGALELEWVADGTTTWWLGARPISGLGDLRVYSRRIARDVLPGVIKPLVWSVNVPVVNSAWLDLLEELVGPLDVRPDDLARSFGYRAYFDMTTIGSVFEALGMPHDTLELLLGLPKGPEAPRFRPGAGAMRHLPRVARAAGRLVRRGRWVRAELRELRRVYDDLAAEDPDVMGGPALLRRLDAIDAAARRAAYANIVVPLTMLAYDRGLALQLQRAGIDPAVVDPAADRPDRVGWSPARSLDAMAALVRDLPEDARGDLATRRTAAVHGRADLAPLRTALDAYLTRFGHLSDSGNDLSLRTWREDPDHVVDLVLAQGERDGTAPAGGSPIDLDAVLRRVPAVQRPLLRLLWRRAGAFRVYRDAVGVTWARIYGLYRPTYLALADLLLTRGAIGERDDVFYLTAGEVRALVGDAPLGDGDPHLLVARRRAEVAEAADLVVPEVVYGDAFVARRGRVEPVSTLTGIPTSRGQVRGTARVVRGAADFERVAPGDILVVPFSDVAWTPLFARASGVVAESGGILSHSSVVAREYGIPCVASVPDACSRIPDGATILLDGAAGSILVEAGVGA